MKPKPRPARRQTADACRSAPPSRSRPALVVLGTAAFALLAIAMLARSLLAEMPTVFLHNLLEPPAGQWSGGMFLRPLTHLLAAAGIGLGVLWAVLARRTWRFSGLELGALVFFGAALLSVPVATDQRVAINRALDVIVPLAAAAVLCQLLQDRAAWRRALLAGLLAVTIANCWKGTAQRLWEYEANWQALQQSRDRILAQAGLDADSQEAAQHLSRLTRSMGYFQHANILASFLVLGLAAAGIALLGAAGYRRRPLGPPGNQDMPRPGGDPGITALAALAATALACLAAWHLLVIVWTGSLTTMIGLAAAAATAGAAWRLRDRPARLALGLALCLLLLQAALLILALASDTVTDSLLSYGGKIRSFAMRLDYWHGALRMLADNPWTGVGPGQYADRYTAIRSIHSVSAPIHSHNWLFQAAAEWGVFGVIGLVVALGLPGWRIIRALPDRPSGHDGSWRQSLLPAMLVVVGVWLVALSDLASQRQLVDRIIPIAMSFAAAALASVVPAPGRPGRILLLGGLIAFCLQSTVESNPGAPGATWPFWATVALALAWTGPQAVPEAVAPVRGRRLTRVSLALCAVAAVAVFALAVRPMRSALLVRQAQALSPQRQPDQALRLFSAAAQADPLDPMPPAAAGLLSSRASQAERDPSLALARLRQSVDFYRQALDRDPGSAPMWRNFAFARMRLACWVEDMDGVREAVGAMRQALERFPTWARCWAELAQMAAVTSGRHPDQPDLLRLGLDALDRAQAVAEARPASAASPFTPKELAEQQGLRDDLRRRLDAVTAAPPTSQPAR